MLLLAFKLWFGYAQSIVLLSVVVAHLNPATSLEIEIYIAELIENLLMVHGGVNNIDIKCCLAHRITYFQLT